jgi:hypothetical protein
MAAQVNAQRSAFNVGAVQPLFVPRAIGSQRWAHDVSPDGQRFLVNAVEEQAEAAPITLVVNWPALLRK